MKKPTEEDIQLALISIVRDLVIDLRTMELIHVEKDMTEEETKYTFVFNPKS